jgi:sugar-specific transcriptional regulator TrmB
MDYQTGKWSSAKSLKNFEKHIDNELARQSTSDVSKQLQAVLNSLKYNSDSDRKQMKNAGSQVMKGIYDKGYVDFEDITILKQETDIVDGKLVFNKNEIIKQFISYAVGVMFGRYSLDHDGLHISNQNESIAEANLKFGITNPTFEADDDNVIPILDGEWFIDDISERFFQFVKVTFGNDSYESNLDFIANALSDKNKNSVETIRKYFLKDFYNDHVKRYKKRPIYWLFTSPKGSFQALIYMHRYKGDTVSVILNDYLREFITKLEATKENLEAVSIKSDATGSEKTKALKEIENIKKMIKELKEYEKDVLYPLATEKIEIDLDDGVKVNYPKFGSALKKIVGLESGE